MNTVSKKMAMVLALSLAIVSIFSSTASFGATTLTVAQKKKLQYLVEEEKLARDVYNYLASNVTTQKFSNIAKSEQTHMNYVAGLLKTYKVSNPAASTKPGVFKDPSLQKLYNELITKGKASVLAAFEVGVAIEEMDIKDLEADLKTNMPADIQTILNSLLSGSQNHLAAFTR